MSGWARFNQHVVRSRFFELSLSAWNANGLVRLSDAPTGLVEGRGAGAEHHPRGALRLGGAGLLRPRRPRKHHQHQRQQRRRRRRSVGRFAERSELARRRGVRSITEQASSRHRVFCPRRLICFWRGGGGGDGCRYDPCQVNTCGVCKQNVVVAIPCFSIRRFFGVLQRGFSEVAWGEGGRTFYCSKICLVRRGEGLGVSLLAARGRVWQAGV